jgi:hypothetical protein
VSADGATCTLVAVTGPIPSMFTLVAPVTVHLRMALCPVVVHEGLAVKLVTTGS